MSDSVILGYWKCRGLAQPIRLLLKYTNTDFIDQYYQRGGAPDFSPAEWTSVKYTLGLDFPNIPYLIDGDVKITQSNAIISHLARKNGLSGKTEAEQAMVDMLLNVAMDFRNGFVRLCYSDNSNFTSQRQKYEDNIKIKLKEFSSFLGQKPWFAGNEITCADFVFYELLDQHKLFNPSLLDGLDNIKGFLSRFEELPAIKAYMNSPEFLRFPVNNTSASWFGSS